MIEQLYNYYKTRPSDINEHLEILFRYGSECDNITEMGVREGESTCALLYSKPKKMTSYDLNDKYFSSINNINEDCFRSSIDFRFILGDTLLINIEETELLFIDTLHTYNQLSAELEKHNDKVSKYIILHDTTTFGYQDENIYSHASEVVKNMKKDKLMSEDDFTLEEKKLAEVIESFNLKIDSLYQKKK